MPSGKIINPFRVTDIISEIDGVIKYQVKQENDSTLCIKVLKQDNRVSTSDMTREIIDRIKVLTRNEIEVMVEYVTEIVRNPDTGMFQLVTSEFKKELLAMNWVNNKYT